MATMVPRMVTTAAIITPVRTGYAQGEVVLREPQVFLGDQLQHDVLPRGPGVRLGLLLGHACASKVLRIGERVKRDGHVRSSGCYSYCTTPDKGGVLECQRVLAMWL
jgi:hypothetical protein